MTQQHYDIRQIVRPKAVRTNGS